LFLNGLVKLEIRSCSISKPGNFASVRQSHLFTSLKNSSRIQQPSKMSNEFFRHLSVSSWSGHGGYCVPPTNEYLQESVGSSTAAANSFGDFANGPPKEKEEALLSDADMNRILSDLDISESSLNFFIDSISSSLPDGDLNTSPVQEESQDLPGYESSGGDSPQTNQDFGASSDGCSATGGIAASFGDSVAILRAGVIHHTSDPTRCLAVYYKKIQ